MSTKKKPSKQIYKTDVPFAPVAWPEVKPNDSTLIVEMLCRLLTPVGHDREARKTTNRKRKRQHDDSHASDSSAEPPLSKFITVGLNSTTQYLERLTSRSAPLVPKERPQSDEKGQTSSPNLSVIFLSFSSSSVLAIERTSSVPLQFQHLPILTQLAARSSTGEEPESGKEQTLLVPLPRSAEKQLAKALGVPRVSAVGLVEGAPGSEKLLSLCREKLEPVVVPWVKEALSGKDVVWKGTKISAEKG